MQSLSQQDGDLFLSHEIIQLGYRLDEIETVKKADACSVYLDLIQKCREKTYELAGLKQNFDK